MTKVMRVKPGPKSVKRNKILAKRGTLGEASSGSDDSGPESTFNESPERRNTRRTANNSSFCTPELEKDVTDYGLEFTTSNIQNPSPRRCSTFQRPVSIHDKENAGSSGGANISNKEDGKSTSALTKSAVKPKSPKKNAKQQMTKTKTPKEKQSSAGETSGKEHKQFHRKPRKQRNPLQIEKKFWKEVKALQNRTDHLIPMLPFSRLVRELIQGASSEVTKITPTALQALQTSSEMYLTQRLQDAYMLTLHRGRVTLDVRDMELIKYLKIDFA